MNQVRDGILDRGNPPRDPVGAGNNTHSVGAATDYMYASSFGKPIVSSD